MRINPSRSKGASAATANRGVSRSLVQASPYNDGPERFAASQVVINDCTLREGQQAAAANLSKDHKLKLLRILARTGITSVQVGYPSTPADCEVAEEGRAATSNVLFEGLVLGYLPSWKDDLNHAASSGFDRVNIVVATSEIRLRYVLRIPWRSVLRRIRSVVRTATSLGLEVAFTPADGTRTSPDRLLAAYAEAVESGAKLLYVADTAGACTPEGMRVLVGLVLRRFGIPVGVHCHNDFGLALANTVAGVIAGAGVADATVNGLGDRAGNAALDEVAVTLEALYGLRTGIRLGDLRSLSRTVAELSGSRVPATKPLVGEDAYAYKLESHVAAVLAHPPAFEVIPAELTGNRRRIVLGAYSGPIAVEAKLKELGLTASADAVGRITRAVSQRVSVSGSPPSDRELADMTKRVVSDTRAG